jgi:hypothetical protein
MDAAHKTVRTLRRASSADNHGSTGKSRLRQSDRCHRRIAATQFRSHILAMSYTDPTKPPVERPRVEPEIIPPNARRGGGGFENLFVRVEESDDGFRRVQIKKIGPFTLAMILLGVGLAVGIVFLLLAGLVLLWIPIVILGILFALFSVSARDMWRRVQGFFGGRTGR